MLALDSRRFLEKSMSVTRLTDFLKLKEKGFVSAGGASCASSWRIKFRHLLHNALAPILAPITFGIATPS